MSDVTLSYTTPDGSESIPIAGEKISFGRGSEADVRFPDDGLSRLHAVLYRDGDRIWIVDQGSTNGTFVNEQKAAPAGTPLKDRDRIKIGNHTILTVHVSETVSAAAPIAISDVPNEEPARIGPTAISLLPVAIIAVAIFAISVSAVLIGYRVLGGTGEVVTNRELGDPPDDGPQRTPKPKPSNGTATNTSTPENSNSADLPPNSNTVAQADPPSGKKYLEMSDTERRQYLEAKAMRVAQVIGNRASGAIPPAAIDKIKGFVDAYASRVKVKSLGGCRFGDNLQATYERASKNAPFVVRAFNEKGIDPRIGLYLAMIESEHCVCLQSPTGPLGMFQFTYATAKLHFTPSDGVRQGSSPGNPDDRCKPEPAAFAAASYMKALTGRYGTGPASVPLAIGSYNSGEGGLSSNLEKALSSNTGLPRDFWTLIAEGDKLSKQFQAENFKYVPKFFAAAIIGENPQDFGLNLQPISTYTK